MHSIIQNDKDSPTWGIRMLDYHEALNFLAERFLEGFDPQCSHVFDLLSLANITEQMTMPKEVP